MLIGVFKEYDSKDFRVAITPTVVSSLVKLGHEVFIEEGAGSLANFADDEYLQNGAKVVKKDQVYNADIFYQFNLPTKDQLEKTKEHKIIVSFVNPAQNKQLIELANQKNITLLAMDMVPRISRAQSMDALSSMANISGYRAVVEAANSFKRFFAGQITAAGKIPPANVLVIGAGVAGLAAIGTAKSLGAEVYAFDTRLEVAEQIESMGGNFLKLDFNNEDGSSADGYAKVMSEEFIKAEMELFAEQAKKVDIIITTAAIPGKESPKLITKDMVASMKSGSVIVDLAALGGGNCEATVPGKAIVTDNGVTIIGYTDFPNRLAPQTSQLYATNLLNLTKLLTPKKDGKLDLNFDDAIVRNMTLCHDKQIMFPPPPIKVSVNQGAVDTKKTLNVQEQNKEEVVGKNNLNKIKYSLLIVLALSLIFVGNYLPEEFLSHLMVFAISCVVGYYVVWNVTHSLHTPLMSVTNAISGIIIIGALLQVGDNSIVNIFSFISILIVSINIFGGFYVTRRMLKMFRKG